LTDHPSDQGHDVGIGKELARHRPVPSPSFRGELARYLAAEDPGHGPRPEHLWTEVFMYALAGLVLMLVGLLIAGGTI
jgi:hypothetical protein